MELFTYLRSDDPAVADAEHRRGREHGEKLHEVLATERRLGFLTDPKDPAVIDKEPRGDQMIGDEPSGLHPVQVMGQGRPLNPDGLGQVSQQQVVQR